MNVNVHRGSRSSWFKLCKTKIIYYRNNGISSSHSYDISTRNNSRTSCFQFSLGSFYYIKPPHSLMPESKFLRPCPIVDQDRTIATLLIKLLHDNLFGLDWFSKEVLVRNKCAFSGEFTSTKQSWKWRRSNTAAMVASFRMASFTTERTMDLALGQDWA